MATFHQLTDEHRDSFIDAVRLNDAFGSAIDICWAIGTFALYFTGIVLLGPDKISLGILIAFGSYISMFWNPIMNLSNFYNQIITNIAGAERIFEILDTESKISDADGVTKLPRMVPTSLDISPSASISRRKSSWVMRLCRATKDTMLSDRSVP